MERDEGHADQRERDRDRDRGPTGRASDGRAESIGKEQLVGAQVERPDRFAAKVDGVDKARQSILKIGKDARVPMMKVYDLYRGVAKPEDVLAAARDEKLTPEQLNRTHFYAHLYVGLYYDATGDKKRALEHLTEAAQKYPIEHYMWDVARVARDVLSAGTGK